MTDSGCRPSAHPDGSLSARTGVRTGLATDLSFERIPELEASRKRDWPCLCNECYDAMEGGFASLSPPYRLHSE
ncbi:MAG: hypothetical protein ACUZ8I_11345 [Candidatus Scalindua sp.]